jgi:hypothetical protein
MSTQRISLDTNDAVIITTPMGKMSIFINGDGIELDLSKEEASISIEIDGINVQSKVRHNDGVSQHSRGNRSQQIQIINGVMHGGQISQSGGDSIQIQTNRW